MAPPNESRPERREESRDEDGLLNDEYSDESLEDSGGLDAMDVPLALRSDSVLADVADDVDGIEELDLLPLYDERNTADGGVRMRDDAEMGLGAEPHSAEELEDAAIGRELRGRAAHTRDDEVHGERLFDSPDSPDEATT